MTVIDLFAFRCAVAVLVHARHNIDALTSPHVHRVNDALRHLDDQLPDLAGDAKRHTAAVLSEAADTQGLRTIRAIDSLAVLANVTKDTAPVLAATLKPAPVQAMLFDADTTPKGVSAEEE